MDKMITKKFICPFCGGFHSVEVNFEEYIKWECGICAQRAFTTLTATEREQIISHICPSCQEDFFNFEEEAEEF